jgi:hypothetical protein
MLRSAVSAAVVFLCWAGSAQARTALLPVDARGLGADGPRAQAALVAALKDVVGGALVVVDAPAPDGAGPPCVDDRGCLTAVARQHEADEVVAVTIERGLDAAHWGHVVVRVFDADGAPRATLSSSITSTHAASDVRALALRAFDPARYAGRIDVTGAAPDDVVSVDGLRISSSSLVVRPGAHRVRVQRAGAVIVDQRVRVSLDERAVVDVAAVVAAPSTVATDGGPTIASTPAAIVVPAIVPAAIAVLAVATGGVLLMRDVVVPPAIQLARDVDVVAGIHLGVVAALATTAAVAVVLDDHGATPAPSASPAAGAR